MQALFSTPELEELGGNVRPAVSDTLLRYCFERSRFNPMFGSKHG
jgi:hypothetical protein